MQKQQKDPLLKTMTGKAFKSADSRSLDKEIRKRLVNMKLDTSKKAGTASNQQAAAAGMWLAHAGGNFNGVTTAWAGGLGLGPLVSKP